MPKLIFLLLLTLLFSCGGSKKVGNNSDTSDAVNDTAPISATDIEISASRDYNPSSWNDFELQAAASANYSVPLELEVIAGNSGTGWASLYIGNRKFCYQENAPNNNTNNGTKFILIKEKSNLSTECYQNQDNIAYNQQVNVSKEDSIRLSINGGGCGPFCMFTEAHAVIELL